MKLSNQEVINVLNAFDGIAEKDLPVKMTFDLYSIHSKLMEVYTIYLKALEKLKKKHGVEDDSEIPESMLEELKELLGIEKELDLPEIKKEELLDSSIELSLTELQALMPVIVDG